MSFLTGLHMRFIGILVILKNKCYIRLVQCASFPNVVYISEKNADISLKNAYISEQSKEKKRKGK